MAVNIESIAAASFLPGLQNNGQISGTSTISGTLFPSPNIAANNTSNMVGAFIVQLPDPQVISAFRVNLPDAHGNLASLWFPLWGTAHLVDSTAHWRLILQVLSDPAGRKISFNFVNLQDATTTFTNFRISIYGHLFSYPWAQAAS